MNEYIYEANINTYVCGSKELHGGVGGGEEKLSKCLQSSDEEGT